MEAEHQGNSQVDGLVVRGHPGVPWEDTHRVVEWREAALRAPSAHLHHKQDEADVHTGHTAVVHKQLSVHARQAEFSHCGHHRRPVQGKQALVVVQAHTNANVVHSYCQVGRRAKQVDHLLAGVDRQDYAEWEAAGLGQYWSRQSHQQLATLIDHIARFVD